MHAARLVAMLLLGAGCARAKTGGEPAAAAAARGEWVGTWAAAQQLTEPRNLPPEPGLAGSTLRQVVHVSIGGTRLRVRFSNAFGDAPVAITSAHLARSVGGDTIESASERALAFGGKSSVTIPPRGTVVSDPLDYGLAPLANVAVTVRFAETARDVTGHPGSRTTSYLQPGDLVSAPAMPDAARTDHWYVLAGIDVEAGVASAAVVALGNSITDGRGSGTNRQNRWPDNLARRLQADPRTARVAVLNAGIGGNCVLRDCLGPAALARLERDVLDQGGARWLIVLEGVNDIGGAQGADSSAVVARGLIAAYQQIIARAHSRGIRAYGATILPFGGSFYASPEHEAARQTVN
ncbi:MAG TPA: GDSL-type esterase/lipase family protein, partial [Gemmatimonadaceae bacterium]|nr:GDSL-type esterase/lipase family protein [Gemmatimonadaceae bacterium]